MNRNATFLHTTGYMSSNGWVSTTPRPAPRVSWLAQIWAWLTE